MQDTRFDDGRLDETRFDTLVTGGTGFIGRWLLAELTRRGRGVIALVRDAEGRANELRSFVTEIGGDGSLVRVVTGDIEREDLGLSSPLPEVRDVFHSAARYSFGMGVAEARRANVDGTLHVARWAHAQPKLRRLVYVGGYRLTRPGPVIAAASAPFDEATVERVYAAHGAYEASKHESYIALRELSARLGIPTTMVHPSGVIGDSRTGRTTQVLGLGETLERVHRGALPALVGGDNTFVPVVTVDHLAALLASVPEDQACAGQDLVVLDARTPPLPRLVTQLAQHMGVEPPTRRISVSTLKRLPRALTKLDPEQLGFLSEDSYDTTAADALAARAGIATPDLDRALGRWCDELVSTRFDPSRDDAPRGTFRRGSFVVGDPARADVVYLHGLPWNGESWRSVSERVGGSFARLDLPGLGRSAPVDDDEVEWLRRLLADRKRKVLLVGQSYGTSLAVRYAAAHPAHVSGLVLAAPAFLQPPPKWWMRIPALVASRMRGADEVAFTSRIVGDDADLDEPGRAAIQSAVVDLNRAGVASRIAHALRRVTSPQARTAALEAYLTIDVPITLVRGDRDGQITDPRGAPMEVIEGAGHDANVTHPALVAGIIERALGTRETAIMGVRV